MKLAALLLAAACVAPLAFLGADGRVLADSQTTSPLTDHPLILARRKMLQTCLPVNGVTECSLYTQGCCGGEERALCTMSIRCSQPGQPDCYPICKNRGDLQGTVQNVTIGNYSAWEAGQPDAPAIIVIQEWWGVNEAIRETAEHLGHQGYRVLIPDLYQGEVALDVAEAMHLSSSLDWSVAIEQIKQAAAYLRETGSPKVGVTGFCMGGGLALCAAQHADVDASAPFYGLPNATYCQVEAIEGVPIQYHLGTNDTSFPLARVQPVIDALNATGNIPDLQFYLYPETGHGFFNGLTPDGRLLTTTIGRPLPPEESVTQSFERVTAFFARYLKGVSP